MESLAEIQAVVGVITSVWGVVALFVGPWLFWKARNYFPERRETITPDQLRHELSVFDRNLRDALNAEVGRLRLSLDQSHAEVMGSLKAVERRADEAYEKSQAAHHEAQLVSQRLHDFDRLVIEKIEHLQTSIRTGK